MAPQHVFLALCLLYKCANLTSQMYPPSKHAKMACHRNTPNPHANVTRQIHEPKIPPSLLKIPRQDTTRQPPPPPPHGSVNGAGGGGGEPTRPAYASCTGTSASLACLHILTGHNIHAFYIERINEYKCIALGEGRIARKG